MSDLNTDGENERSTMQSQKTRISRYAIRLHSLYAGGLIAISLIILQDFIAVGKLDLPAHISVVAFAAAVPLLSGMLIANIVKSRYSFSSARSALVRVVESSFYFGILIDLVGIGAAFWHTSLIAGIVFIVMVAVSSIIYSIDIVKLSDERMPSSIKSRDREESSVS